MATLWLGTIKALADVRIESRALAKMMEMTVEMTPWTDWNMTTIKVMTWVTRAKCWTHTTEESVSRTTGKGRIRMQHRKNTVRIGSIRVHILRLWGEYTGRRSQLLWALHRHCNRLAPRTLRKHTAWLSSSKNRRIARNTIHNHTGHRRRRHTQLQWSPRVRGPCRREGAIPIDSVLAIPKVCETDLRASLQIINLRTTARDRPASRCRFPLT